jgi:hypothetical protein
MEEKSNNIAKEPETEDFNFKLDFIDASLGALYYIFVYIPFILPYKVWGKAATRLSLLWEDKSIAYDENGEDYPLFKFWFNYVINFLFDILMFLVWPIGLIYATYDFIDSMLNLSSSGQMEFLKEYVNLLFISYFAVLVIRLSKETLFFILNNLVKWILDVVVNIGKLIKNMWLLNFVFKNKKDQ